MSVTDQAGIPKRGPGRPRKDTTSPDVATVEKMPAPIGAERVMQERRAKEYPALAAQNADQDGVDNTGRQQAEVGDVMIQAITDNDLHLGDGRILHGRGEGVFGETDPSENVPWRFPQKARVTKEVADILVAAHKAKHA